MRNHLVDKRNDFKNIVAMYSEQARVKLNLYVEHFFKWVWTSPPNTIVLIIFVKISIRTFGAVY